MSDTTTRVAIVTGGSQGIGKSIALELAKDGLDIVIADLGFKSTQANTLVDEIIKTTGRRAIFLPTDVTKEQDVATLVENVVKVLGRLDVMVANAGIGIASREIGGNNVLTADIAGWENLWSVNVRGVILSYKYAAQQMVKQGQGGRIIGAASICGQQGFSALSAYCMSKAAVISLTQCVALELREHKITVNAYAPGLIDTPMTRGAHANDPDPLLNTKNIMNLSADCPTGQVDDIAGLVSYLVSPKASFITGETISINGGLRVR